MSTTAGAFLALLLGLAGAACGPVSGSDDTSATSGGPQDEGGDEVLECFEADQPIEPTFDTPEAALEHALEVDTADVPVPDDVEDYDAVERSDGSTEYAFREGEDHYATWVVAQDEDGRFGVISLSGCSPATR